MRLLEWLAVIDDAAFCMDDQADETLESGALNWRLLGAVLGRAIHEDPLYARLRTARRRCHWAYDAHSVLRGAAFRSVTGWKVDNRQMPAVPT